MTDTQAMTPALAAALVRAQAQMRPVGKDSTNQFHRYKYASSEDIIDASRDVLTANGLSFTVEGAAYTPIAGEAVWGGVAILGMSFVLEHASGEQRRMTSSIPVCPEKGRPLDKALFAARTEGLGYALRDLLLIPRLDAQDIQGRPDRPVAFLDAAAGDSGLAKQPAAAPVRINGTAVFAAAQAPSLLGLLSAARGSDDGAQAEQHFAARVAVLLSTADAEGYDELLDIAKAAGFAKGSQPHTTIARALAVADSRIGTR